MIIFENEYIVSCEWTLELFVNSCDGALIKSIKEKQETLDKLEQGGIMYLKIEFLDMFNMSNVVITSFHDFINKFPRMGFTRFQTKCF